MRLLRIALLAVLPGLFLMTTARGEDNLPPVKDEKTGLDIGSLFKKLDANNDGKITPDEFSRFTELPELKDKLTLAPKGFDLEKLKDKLSPEQLEKLKERFTPEKLEKLKERFGGNIDAEKLKKLLEKRKDKN